VGFGFTTQEAVAFLVVFVGVKKNVLDPDFFLPRLDVELAVLLLLV
jgi:hypothetical protein